MPRRRVVEDDDDDDDYRGGTQSQAAPATQSGTQSAALTPSEVNKKAKEVVKYLLLVDVKKVPVKRADIAKNVMKENARSLNTVLEKATKELKDVFGFDLIEVDKKSKTYLLVSELDADARTLHYRNERDLEKMALVMPILGLIFMSGNSVDDGTLWHFLEKLGLTKEEYHPTFGPLEKFLKQEMAKEGYLHWTKIGGTDPAQFTVEWGGRAEKEVSKMDCLKFVCEVYSHKSEVQVTPKDWQVQFKQAQADEAGEQDEEEEED